MNIPDLLYPIVGLVLLVVLLVLLVTSRYKVAGPNQAFIVTGRKGKAVLNPETGALTMEALGGLRDPWIEGQNEMRGDWLLATMRPRMKDSTLEKCP